MLVFVEVRFTMHRVLPAAEESKLRKERGRLQKGRHRHRWGQNQSGR